MVVLKVSLYHLGLANHTTPNGVLVFEVLEAAKQLGEVEGNRLKKAPN